MSKPHSDNFSFRTTINHSGIPDKAALILATWLGTGLIPVASGTFGTVGAVPLAVWLQQAGPLFRCAMVVSSIGVAMWAADRARRLIGREDPSQVVVDEVVGYLTAAALLPSSWTALVLGFFLFRLFDIWKPFPVRQMERLPGGVGIVMDDVVAGLYTALVAKAILMLFSGIF
ncbi:MAG: phosphatidylglycerophosphatase A [Deltaproteobacteria bacterium]|nr:phosphatidylglycerophosphatase A [Deltaproteobacteria bacterium]